MMGLKYKPSQIFVDGKPLGIVENVHFSTEDPVSDFKPGSYQNSLTFEVKNADMGPELKKIIDELKHEYRKIMDIQKRLNELLMEVGKMVPTMIFIGTTEDKHGALMMASPEKEVEKHPEDLAKTVAMMIEQREDVRDIILSSVCYFMQMHPEYQARMYEALAMMKQKPQPAPAGEA